MKYLLTLMVVISAFLLSPVQTKAQSCYVTVSNCLPEEFGFCTYDSSSFWDTIVANEDSYLTSEETNYFFGCASSSSCYFIGQESDSAATYTCLEYDVEGSVNCDEYACVDTDSTGAITWNSGDTEYYCDGTGGDACQTDSD